MTGGGGTVRERIAHSRITRQFRSRDGQMLFAGGKGGEVWDADGATYVDFVMGYGPVILGHAVDDFNDRVRGYLSNGIMMPGYTVFHDEYLARLLAARPGKRGAFFKTGSEAVTAALRIAALETGKRGVIRCGYIGWHDAHIADSPKWHEPLHSPLRAALRYTTGMRGVGPTEPAVNWIDLRLDSLARLLEENRRTVGCFVFDAYLASMAGPDLWREAITMCREAGLLTVSDETKTGGRISRLGYAHDTDLDTDLIVIGKALANGAPLSVLVGDAYMLGHAEQVRLGGTFAKEMVAIYAALATMDIMELPIGKEPDGWAEVGRIGTQVATVIARAAEDAAVAAQVSARPVLGGGMFELTYSDEVLGNRELRAGLMADLIAAGVLPLDGHPLFVCLAHRDIAWDQFQSRVSQAFRQWSIKGWR